MATATQLKERIKADGFDPLPFARIADVNAVAETACPCCGRSGSLAMDPFWKHGDCRLVVTCVTRNCGYADEM